MEMTFTIGFNKAAQRYISSGQAQRNSAIRDLLAEAFFGSYSIFSPISNFQELDPSKKNARFSVTLNDRLSEVVRSEGKKPEAVLEEVIGTFLRKSCKVWDQEGYKFTTPVLC